MIQLTVEEAAARLLQLADEINAGEEIVLTKDNQPVFRPVRLPKERLRTQFGSARGLGYMTADFDAPLENFKDCIP